MKRASVERDRPRLDSDDAAARKRAAVETYARNETALRRTARRYSLCEDDADEALQRALEILLRKAPRLGSEALVKWTQTVVKHEALAIRAERDRTLASPLPPGQDHDWVSLLPAEGEGPAERVERSEAVARSREALQALKPQELRALTLLAEGYSYAEIGEITGFSQTKVNRCLAEGRERFRSLLSRSEDGRRCAEMRPLISAFCDGEAGTKEVAALREHLRACASCRATLRTYRAAPAAAAALTPALPLHRSLLERAHDAFAEAAARFGGGRGGGALSQAAGSSGAGGLGATAAAKFAALCIATAGSAAACVATGLLPTPLDAAADPAKPAALERQHDIRASERTAVEYEPTPVEASPEPKPDAHPTNQHHHRHAPVESAPATTEPAPEASEPASSNEAVEYAPPPPAPEPEPAPVSEPAPAESSEAGDPAGEFGP
ncbi:MAG TPA: sigma-70 family RNA polymerase sigma factor [Solirubrobacterales bacterium]|nr:sigma-70 family RNA polymerase sigma factor [Solirubrobacterales bacterium]